MPPARQAIVAVVSQNFLLPPLVTGITNTDEVNSTPATRSSGRDGEPAGT